jgi:glycosyltransferase involved in cell wall biosynthesis
MNAFKDLARPTILQILPALETGGAERTTLDVAAAIVNAGGRALVASRGGRMLPELLASGAEHIELAVHSKNPVIMALNVERLTRIVTREHVSLLHARSRAPAWSALAAARRTTRTFVTTYHSKVHEAPRLKVFYNSVMAKGDAVIANSQFTADQIARVHAPDAAKVFVVPRGVDTQYFNANAISPQRIEACRQRWNLPADAATVFLLPARLSEWKGQRVAIEASALLQARGLPPFRLVLVGDDQGRGKYRTALTSAIHQSGLDKIVSLPGHCEDMPAAYALADAVLAPSLLPEPFGRPPIEAGAMRLPVIASDAGGMRETVLAEQEAGIGQATGWRVKAGDAEALAGAMQQFLLMSRDERRAMGMRGHTLVEGRYSLQAMCEATLGIYAKLLGNG